MNEPNSILQGSVAHRGWTSVVDPVTKLLMALDLALLSFCFTNLLVEIALVFVVLVILLISKAGKSTVHAIEFSSFLIFTMLIIQGLFYSHNQTLLVSVVGIRFYQEGLLYAATMGCRIFVIILATSFFMTTTTVSENSKYLEQVGLSYKAVYVLMSVCYILPEMMANMKKIQMAQRARGINQQKTILEKIKSILPVLIPLVIKTLDQSMERSIALRLRGFNSPHRVALKSANLYRHEMVNHRGLSLLAIILIGWKLWIIGSKFI